MITIENEETHMDIINCRVEKIISNHLGVTVHFVQPIPTNEPSSTSAGPQQSNQVSAGPQQLNQASTATVAPSPQLPPEFENVTPIPSPAPEPRFSPTPEPRHSSTSSTVICQACNYRWDGYAQHTCLSNMQ